MIKIHLYLICLSNLLFLIEYSKVSLMGSCVDKGQQINNNIRVVTLNYSGIINSPFQFFSQEGYQNQSQLSRIFNVLLQRQQIYLKSNGKFKWQMGKIDQKIQKQRYSPVYVEGAGVQDNHFLDQQGFKKKWYKHFDQSYKLKHKQSFVVEQSEKQRAMIFDLLCYKTFLTYLYGDEDIEDNIIKRVTDEKKSVIRYLQFAKNAFSKPYLDDKKKSEMTIRILRQTKISIIFLQQANLQFRGQLQRQFNKQYLIKGVQNGNSIVMVHRSLDSVDKTKQLLPNQKIIKQLNWNEDTVLLITRKLVLISGHLSSKKQKNLHQTTLSVEHLIFLRKQFPKHSIIVGSDFNNSDYPQIEGFHRYPRQQSEFTTRKKRTFMQAQYNKAEQETQKRSDYIISSFPMKKASVCMLQSLQNDLNKENQFSKHFSSSNLVEVTQKSIKQIYLPNSDHPFDHFLVFGQFDPKQLV